MIEITFHEHVAIHEYYAIVFEELEDAQFHHDICRVEDYILLLMHERVYGK